MVIFNSYVKLNSQRVCSRLFCTNNPSFLQWPHPKTEISLLLRFLFCQDPTHTPGTEHMGRPVDLKNNKSQEGSKNTLIRKHWKSLSVRELSAKYVVVESSQPNMGRTCWWQAEMGAKTHFRRLHIVSSYPIKKSIIWLAARPSLWIVFDMVSWMCHLQTTLCRGHGQTRCIPLE